METIEHHTFDKSKWDKGPWTKEPDKIQFADPETGMPCLIVRNYSGALCGYVGVAEGHLAFEQSYEEPDVNVHGGLTFAGFCREGAEEHGICHVPGPGEPDRIWWLGFDCAHAGDYMPQTTASLRESGFFEKHPESVAFHKPPYERYRTVAYVKKQCAKLANQLEAMCEKNSK